jgi:1,4-dihydroxy-6-naphthoate synthase
MRTGFTYQDKGLEKITDLGDYWETQTGSSIPLGGIVIDKNMSIELQQQVDRLIRKSIEFAFSIYPELNDYIRLHAQEMSEDVMRKHIDLVCE